MQLTQGKCQRRMAFPGNGGTQVSGLCAAFSLDFGLQDPWPALPVPGRLITASITQALVSWLPVGFSHRENRQQIQGMREMRVFILQLLSPSDMGTLAVDGSCHNRSIASSST